MAPAKRKAGAATQTASKKIQKTQKKGKSKPKPREIHVPVDEAFSECSGAEVVISDDGTIYDASMNQTNVGDNNNKFYFLQLLKCKNCGQFYTHTRWGRVGEFGQSKTI